MFVRCLLVTVTMVMNTTRNNYKLDSPSNNKDFYQAAPHPMNYNNWYSDSSTQHEEPHKEETEEQGRCACLASLCRQDQRSAHEESAAPNNVMASYGVYGTGREEDDDDGFVPRPRYHHSVVNVTGNTNILRENEDNRTCCMSTACCSSESAVPNNTETNCCTTWCRPTILLLLLVLLVVVFVLISGILLYYNCMYSI